MAEIGRRFGARGSHAGQARAEAKETISRRPMGVAFEMARVALGLAEDRDDLANEMIAKRIIELAKAGERNPDLLCESAVKEFRERLQTSG
jgi:hypothetical protein